MGVFNLGFATYEGFRSLILDDILRLKLEEPSELVAINESWKSSEVLSKFGVINLFDKRMQAIAGEHDKIRKALIERAKIALRISEINKANFLYTGIYCLIILILSGYQELLGDNSTNLFIFIFNFSFIFNLLVFFKSFPRFNKKQKQISPVMTLLICCGLLILSACICRSSWNMKIFSLPVNIGISILFSISSFLLHFLRLFQHRLHYQPQLNRNEAERAKKMDDLNRVIELVFLGESE